MSVSLDFCLYAATAVFSIGVYGVLSRQNALVILMSLELMLNGVNLALVGFGRQFLASPLEGTAGPSTAAVFVVIVLAVAAAEAAVGLAILLAVYRRWRSANAGDLDLLKG